MCLDDEDSTPQYVLDLGSGALIRLPCGALHLAVPVGLRRIPVTAVELKVRHLHQ